MPTFGKLSLTGIVVLCCGALLRADDWPQWRGPQRDGVWRETGLVDRFESAELPLLWRAPLSGGYSGPTVAEGRVLVTDRVDEPREIERVHAFAAGDGKLLWQFEYPADYGPVSYKAGPRASVTVHRGRAYVLGSAGHLHCLDAATGKVLWKKIPGEDLTLEVPTWGIAAAPLVEGHLLVVQIGAKPGGCVTAFDARTGEVRWQALDDEASYAAPVAIDQAGRRVIVCWTGLRLTGLDAGDGSLLWEYPWPPERWVIGIATPVVWKDRLLISSFYEGALLARLDAQRPAIHKLWHRRGQNELNTDALQCLLSTPILDDEAIYGFDAYGQFRCLDAATGDRLWENTTVCEPVRWGMAHMVRQGDRTWLFNDRGELIIARLARTGYEEISRAKLIAPTRKQLARRDGVTWSHPAFAGRCVFARNDEEIVCANLAAGK